MSKLLHIEDIGELFALLPSHEVEHPLVGLVNFDDYESAFAPGTRISLGFYTIILADSCQHKLWYGQRPYDFSAGNMLCIAPHQVLTIGEGEPAPRKEDSWGLFFHPDLLRRMPLGKTIGEYSFFGYQINEALHLAPSERATLRELLERIRQELRRGIDKHTQTLIVSNIELMLNYCTRYYERQFITRSYVEGNPLERFETILAEYMQQDNLEAKGLPSVSYMAEQVQNSLLAI